MGHGYALSHVRTPKHNAFFSSIRVLFFYFTWMVGYLLFSTSSSLRCGHCRPRQALRNRRPSTGLVFPRLQPQKSQRTLFPAMPFSMVNRLEYVEREIWDHPRAITRYTRLMPERSNTEKYSGSSGIPERLLKRKFQREMLTRYDENWFMHNICFSWFDENHTRSYFWFIYHDFYTWLTIANKYLSFSPVYAPFFGAMGCTASIVFTCFGAAYGTAKSGVGITATAVLRPDLIVKSKTVYPQMCLFCIKY